MQELTSPFWEARIEAHPDQDPTLFLKVKRNGIPQTHH